MTLRVLEKCFWPGKNGKNSIFWKCPLFVDLVLKYCSDINEGNRLRLLFTSFYWWVQLPRLLERVFFLLCFIFYFEVFSNCIFSEMFASWFRNWLDQKWIALGFFLGRWLFSLVLYLYGLKPAWIAEICFFLMTTNLSITLLGDTWYFSLIFKCAGTF